MILKLSVSVMVFFIFIVGLGWYLLITPTIYEELAKSHIQSASINGLIHRGDHAHRLHAPTLVSGMNLLPHDVGIKGPALLSMGNLSQFNPENDWYNYVWKSTGINNQFTANELAYFIHKENLSSFTLAYFPKLDQQVHDHGPKEKYKRR